MTGRLSSLHFLVLSFLLMTVVVLLFHFMDLRINLTASMPIGLYQQQNRSVLHDGDIIAFCLPEPIASEGKARGYLTSGSCPSHSAPLLKKIIALPGDNVILSQHGIWVNGVTYYAPQQKRDHRRQLITYWVKNAFYKRTQNVWVYGDHDPIHSWDSRYFGGIPKDNILGIYKILWVI